MHSAIEEHAQICISISSVHGWENVIISARRVTYMRAVALQRYYFDLKTLASVYK